MNKDENIIPLIIGDDGEFYAPIKYSNNVIDKLKQELDKYKYFDNCNILIQEKLIQKLKAEKEKNSKALELINERLKENDGHVNARIEMLHYRTLKDILGGKK